MRVLFWLIIAVLTLISVFHVERGVFFHGPTVAMVAGTLLAVALAIMLFNRVQKMLLMRGLIDQKVRTPYDIFPLLLIIPFILSFTLGGEGWRFTWGGPERGFIFVAILGLIYVYRIVRLMDLVIDTHQRK